MEKMTSEKRCDHVKCYSQSQVKLDGRLVKPWICELCGAEGHDDARTPHGVVVGRFSQLVERKRRGGV